jgi:hypothetical protein
MTETPADLKLIAFDADDLAIVSAHLQDAVAQIGDMAYLPREQRFVMLLNRFDWGKAAAPGSKDAYERRRAALRIDRVLKAKLQGIDLKAKRQVLAMLAVQYTPNGSEDPGGTLTLVFAGGPAIRLDVECIEAALEDLGAAWKTKRKPRHPGIG